MSRMLHFVRLLLLFTPVFATPSSLFQSSLPKFEALPDDHLTVLAPSNGNPANYNYTFDQLLDHTNPSLGTFKQRYFFDDTYYKAQGSPIVLTTPGEQDGGAHYTTLGDGSMMNTLMKNLGAAGVVLEHRYWGQSSPYQDLTTEHLQYLTLDQSMEDFKYFVENVKLPFAASKGVASTTPDTTPWVHIGCSYPGVLTAYIQQKWPDLFVAAWSSSAPVQARSDFWEYYSPIEEGMPKNCSKDMAAVVTHFDSVFDTGDAAKILDLKSMFGMENVTNDDFGSWVASVTSPWQGLEPRHRVYSDFYKFCDAVEALPSGHSQTEEGVGLDRALVNYALYWKSKKVDPIPRCRGGACYTTYDYTTSTYTDRSVSNRINRQWKWMVCNEFGWFQTGHPGSTSHLKSKYATEQYNLRQCDHMFPLADGTLKSYAPDITGTNNRNKGWNLMGNHLFVVNGEFDPWRSASLSSKYGPSRTDTDSQKIVVIPGGHHCWDWNMKNADLNPDVKRVIDLGLAQIDTWVQLWRQTHPSVTSLGVGGANTTTEPYTILFPAQGGLEGPQKETGSAPNSKALTLSSLAFNGALLLGLVFALIMHQRRSRKIRASRKTELESGEKLGPYGATFSELGGSRGTIKA